MTDYSESGEVKDTALSGNTNTGKVISAVALSKDKVFIAWNSQSVCGVVCTISDITISVGTPIVLYNTYNSNKISAVSLNENKVFIAYSYTSNNSSSTDYLCGIVCTIDGNVITKGTHTALNTKTNSGNVISAVKLEEGKVFIAHSYESNYQLYGMVCTISGTSISHGTDTQLSTTSSSGSIISAVRLEENKILVLNCDGTSSSGTLYKMLTARIITVNGTTITKGTAIQLSTTQNSGLSISVIALSNSKVFIAHSYSTYYLYGMVCTISGTTISKGTDTLIKSTWAGVSISTVALNRDKICLFYGDSYYHLFFINCKIDDMTITTENEGQLSNELYTGARISAILVDDNKIFIAHSYNSDYYLYGMVIGYLANLVKTITSSTEQIGGVAITSGQDGEMITTVRPDDVLNLTLNATISAGGNSINWDNVKLSHRKVLDGKNPICTAEKTLTIDGTVYTFMVNLNYRNATNPYWELGFSCNHEFYSGATLKSFNYYWNKSEDVVRKSIITPKTYTGTVYTGANNTGTAISITATIMDIN